MNAVKVASLLEPERVVRRLPSNIRPGDERLFSHELVRDLAATRALSFEHVDLLPNGFLVSGFVILPASFTSPPGTPTAIKRWVRMLSYRAASRRVTPVEKAQFCTDEFSNGYFHWICDVLPRLEASTDTRDSAGRTLVIPAMAQASYITPSLTPFALPRILHGSWGERLAIEDLLVISQVAPTGNYRPSLMDRVRHRFRRHFKARRSLPQNIHQQTRSATAPNCERVRGTECASKEGL